MTVGSRNTLTLSGPSLGQIRVRVAPSVAGQALNFTHMGIGKWDGTANKSNTTAAPIEVTFNGGHGLTINPGGASVWSDWINVSSLSLNTGDKVVICTDEATNCGYRTSFNNSNATSAYSSLPTWNDATADNVDQSGSWVFGIAEIQTLGAVTVFTPTTPLNTNNNDPNTGLRVVVSVTAAVVSQLRIQFQPNQAGQPATDIANMGVGKWAGNLGDTTATPIRVTWNNGQPGLSVAAGTPAIWSDWIDVSSLSVVAGQQLVITMDNGPSGGYYSSTGNTNVLCFLTSVPSWNLTTIPGASAVGGVDLGIVQIQTSGAGTGGSAPTASPSGSTIPPSPQLIDSGLNVWTVSGGVIYMNATIVTGTSGVTLLLYYNGSIYQQTSAGWWVYSAGTWTVTSDPRSAPPPPTGNPITISNSWDSYNYYSGDIGASNPPATSAQTFWAEIEPFNVGSMVRGVDYTSSLTIYPASFPNGTKNTWSYPEVVASGHVYGADLIQFGAYYNGSPWHNQIAPCQIKNLTSWTATHDVSYTGESAHFDTIYDFYTWATSTPTNSIMHEFSLTIHPQDYEAAMVAGLASNLKSNFTDPQGRNWILYCLSGPGTGHQYVYTKADGSDTLTGTLDIKAFINHAVAIGWLSADEWVTGTGLACEVAQGFGTFTINSWSFVYNGVTYQR